ncbi:MAG: 4-(cytidine 5'-diphospho)-2-C-methyl-D-erythritol kinase [Alphaproteobacteria bacterium]|nr:4-(cytidine 5'-diphospho)-2-C-methyl-D-erythritol kinase [Alphaproteobacteria bacterium]
MPALHAFAPAKINLYLHVTGRREDGYHFLDSLVAFTNIGDSLRLEPAADFDFTLEGPMAAQLSSGSVENNLAVRALRALAQELDRPLNVKATLVKNLPVASGIGGGSSDAAAALRLLAEHWGVPSSDSLLRRIAASLGQDVPCCVDAATCYFRDIGNVTDPGPDLPHTDIVLVNPNKALPTPDVYKAFKGTFAAPARLTHDPKSNVELAGMLHERSNSLTEAACLLMPEIRDILAALAASPDCQLARMSGSGATCFGLYPNRSASRQAAARLYEDHPGWWVVPGFLPYRGNAA